MNGIIEGKSGPMSLRRDEWFKMREERRQQAIVEKKAREEEPRPSNEAEPKPIQRDPVTDVPLPRNKQR